MIKAMKNIKKMLVLASCALVLGAGASAFAEEAGNVELNKADLAGKKIMVNYKRCPSEMQIKTGEITAIDGDMVTVTSEFDARRGVVGLVSKETYVIDGETGKLKRATALKVGQKVTLYHSLRMTRSIPPQAEAYAIVIGSPSPEVGQYFVVDRMERDEEGRLKVYNEAKNLIATIPECNCVEVDKIHVGSKLVIWYDIMTMSLPALTNATKVVVLP